MIRTLIQISSSSVGTFFWSNFDLIAAIWFTMMGMLMSMSMSVTMLSFEQVTWTIISIIMTVSMSMVMSLSVIEVVMFSHLLHEVFWSLDHSMALYIIKLWDIKAFTIKIVKLFNSGGNFEVFERMTDVMSMSMLVLVLMCVTESMLMSMSMSMSMAMIIVSVTMMMISDSVTVMMVVS